MFASDMLYFLNASKFLVSLVYLTITFKIGIYICENEGIYVAQVPFASP